VSDFERHVKVEVLCHDGLVSEVVQAIRDAARTGLVGDGVIYVCPVEDAIRIGTGARGDAAC
jgi:nitrogen regulatory protein P-II 1